MRPILRSKRTIPVWSYVLSILVALIIFAPRLLGDLLLASDSKVFHDNRSLLIAVVAGVASIFLWAKVLREWEPQGKPTVQERYRGHYWFWPFSFILPSWGEVQVPRAMLFAFWGTGLTSAVLFIYWSVV